MVLWEQPRNAVRDGMEQAGGLVRWGLLQDPAILERCQRQLREEGVTVLKNFATEHGLSRLRSECAQAPSNEAERCMTGEETCAHSLRALSASLDFA